MKRLFATTFFAALATACVAPNYGSPIGPGSGSDATPSVTHFYDFTVTDISGTPIESVEVSADVTFNSINKADAQTCTTDAAGVCTIELTVPRDPSLRYSAFYASRITYKVTGAGLYPKTGFLSNMFGSSSATDRSNRKSEEVKLYRPLDYMSARFIASANKGLISQASGFVDVLRTQGMLVDTDVVLGGIDESKFKEKKYFRLELNSTTEYNSIKLDKYQIGKRLFDDSVRKILDPINSILGGTDYFGYDIVIYGHHRNFVEKYSISEKVQYRFLMPRPLVKKYKDQDISGQQLLDGSVLLMDDERIELKLQ